MVEKLLYILEEKDLTYNEILKELKIDKKELNIIIDNLIKQGLIINTNKDKYRLVSKTNLIKGRCIIRKDNTLIVRTDNEDIKINNYNNINNNDIVLVDNSYNPKIVRVIDKYIPKVVGEVIIKNNNYYVLYDNLLYKLNNINNIITNGYMVYVSLDNSKYEANIIDIIGHKNEIDLDITPYAYEYGITDNFSDEYLKELENIPSYLTEEEIQRLIMEDDFVDLRDKLIYTIDSDSTKDIDDAISIEIKDDGSFITGTHIALVAYFIRKDSILYNETIERGISSYPLDKVIPMTHYKLSNGICSLNPNTDRLALSTFITRDSYGKVKKVDIKLSIINSKKKMTYNEVNSILEDNIVPNGYEEFKEDLLKQQYAYNILRKKQENDGFIDFYSPEVKYYKDNNIEHLEKRINKTSENLIEFLMLAHNEDLTSYLTKRGLKLLYRTEQKPNQLKLNSFMNFLSYKNMIKHKDNYNREDIKKVLRSLKDTKYQKVYNNYLIRCMSKATFNSNNIGHYATGKKIYGMHTSPIRRGEDFINQQIILDYLKYGVEYTNMLWEDELEQLADHFTKKEVQAEKLEQIVLKNKLIENLHNYIGVSYNGIISSVTNYGFYVEIDQMYEGLVNRNSLKGKMEYIDSILSYKDKVREVDNTLKKVRTK